jgi:hypothetical protein
MAHKLFLYPEFLNDLNQKTHYVNGKPINRSDARDLQAPGQHGLADTAHLLDALEGTEKT